MTKSENLSGENQTISNVLILVGFSNLGKLQILLFVLFLVIYLFTLMGNLLIILLVKLNPSLHTPMYFFVVNLSFVEMCYTTSVLPQLLVHLLMEEKTISIVGCAVQMFIFFVMGVTKCCLLAAMAYDRYMAICHPLRYTTILSSRVCALLVGAAWISSMSVAGPHSTWIFSQPFCGSNHVHHYLCNPLTVQKMVCTYTWKNMVLGFSLLALFVIGPFSLIILSYIRIISTILKLPTAEGRRKAFSTCSSHIMVVTLIYGAGLLGNLNHTSNSTPESDQLISIMYTVVTPALNPIIYTLKNKEVKGAFRNTVRKTIFFKHAETSGNEK